MIVVMSFVDLGVDALPQGCQLLSGYITQIRFPIKITTLDDPIRNPE